MYIFKRATGVMLNFGPKMGQVKVCLAQGGCNALYGSYIQYLSDKVTRRIDKHWICGPTEIAKLTHSLLHMLNGEEGVIQPTLARGMWIEEEEVIYIGQGYRYALQDQDTFCLVIQDSLQGKKWTTGGGIILQGWEGDGMVWWVMSLV